MFLWFSYGLPMIIPHYRFTHLPALGALGILLRQRGVARGAQLLAPPDLALRNAQRLGAFWRGENYGKIWETWPKKHEKTPENHEQWWFVDEKTVGKSWTMGKSLKHMGKHPINWNLNAKSWENMGNPRTQCWRVSTRYKLILTIVNLVNLLDTYRP